MSAQDNLSGYQFSEWTSGPVHTIQAKHKGEVIAHAQIEPSITSKGGAAWIDALAVRPGHRGKGIASELMSRVVSHYGSKEIGLEAEPYGIGPKRPDQERLMGFYRSYGFSDTGNKNEMRRPGQ